MSARKGSFPPHFDEKRLSGHGAKADRIAPHQYEWQSWPMGELLIRGIGLLMALWAAYQGGRQFLSGSIFIKDSRSLAFASIAEIDL
jgi:hypothetical protein